MPKIVTKKTRFPEGWEVVKDTLDEFERKMREALADPHEGKRKVESVYDFCLKQGYADASLIAKWKKTGYEKLCCLKCIQTRDSNTGGTCICRVPKSKLESGTIVQCTNCGCRGCASCDV
eukprot:MONOS_12091.1-p1 / transcript=MONOS_12091.1 / gene=MONOS_12091 / organism=Monocercomonoides_exilis_PA203 / gene_product=bud site selection protein 31 / transcript_product=bud site selection protein 31 / location=Mono_scaffold00644:31843-32455(+) / protein_length=120 / sequence_SO=supercontig / SO=protein_coding / is_pseudo=false